jgi:thiamine-phosphate pyrophosphorylase
MMRISAQAASILIFWNAGTGSVQFILPKIYPITDKQLAHKTTHLAILKELVRGGAQLVQIRDKSTPVRELMPDLCRCVEFASSKGVTLIVNDRCDIALICAASGVHLGQDDLPAEKARALLGKNKILGLSAHSIPQVRKSIHLPVQYIGFGPVYATATKADAFPAAGTGLRNLARACRESAVPVVAIGGIGLEQICDVLRAGAASAAVISALMKAKNLAGEMQKFLEKAREK